MADQPNFQKVIAKGLNYWYLFITILPISLFAAYAYLYVTPPKYEAIALLMIQDEKSGGGRLTEEAIFAELGMGGMSKNLENEAMVLRSTIILREVVRKLGLQYNYVNVDGYKRRVLYKNSPVQVANWEPAYEHAGLLGNIILGSNGQYQLETETGTYSGEFGKKLETPTGDLTLTYIADRLVNGTIELEIMGEEGMAWNLNSRLEIDIVGDKSSTLQLSIKDESHQRAKDILNATIAAYNQKTVNDKNSVYQGTIELINERVYMINQELTQAEQNVESYKRQFNVMELSTQGSMLMNELASYDKQISETHVQLEILRTIEEILAKNQNFEFVPTNLALQNLTISQQIAQFNEILAERERKRASMGLGHPELKLIEKQIQNLRGTIVENIQSMRRDLEITVNSFQNQKQSLSGRMANLPRRERELIEIERIKNIKENLFLYLLEKREESAIRQQATTPAGQIVEPAAASTIPAAPKAAQVWLIAIFLGLALPSGIAFVVESLNDKVMTQQDVEEATTAPVAAVLSQSKKKETVVVKKDSRTVVSEMFRLLRANLSYIMPEKDLKSLLITSSLSGEGKSFISINLAMTMALTNKRVIIVELDLRKPKQEAYLGIKDSERRAGVVDYLVDPRLNHKEIIRNSGLHRNLDFIASGPKPPNPSELTLSPRLRDLIAKLSAEYDFMILDAPPVGLVADALQIKDMADATMYVVRSGITRKPHLQIIQDIVENQKLPRPFVVLNGVNRSGVGPYGYGYGSSKGYLED